jgi:hypothetical protein
LGIAVINQNFLFREKLKLLVCLIKTTRPAGMLGMDVKLHAFLTSAMGGQPHAWSFYLTGKRPHCLYAWGRKLLLQLDTRLCGPHRILPAKNKIPIP